MTTDWVEYWKQQDAWSLRELAKLCCGWNPSDYQIPDRVQYDAAVRAIRDAVRTGALRTLDTPDAASDFLYDERPLFRPRLVVAWAAAKYPLFPYRTDEGFPK